MLGVEVLRPAVLPLQVYKDFEHIRQFPCPYIPGCLAYREMPFYRGGSKACLSILFTMRRRSFRDDVASFFHEIAILFFLSMGVTGEYCGAHSTSGLFSLLNVGGGFYCLFTAVHKWLPLLAQRQGWFLLPVYCCT